MGDAAEVEQGLAAHEEGAPEVMQVTRAHARQTAERRHPGSWVLNNAAHSRCSGCSTLPHPVQMWLSSTGLSQAALDSRQGIAG